jgi:hypothetical protein
MVKAAVTSRGGTLAKRDKIPYTAGRACTASRCVSRMSMGERSLRWEQNLFPFVYENNLSVNNSMQFASHFKGMKISETRQIPDQTSSPHQRSIVSCPAIVRNFTKSKTSSCTAHATPAQPFCPTHATVVGLGRVGRAIATMLGSDLTLSISRGDGTIPADGQVRHTASCSMQPVPER